MHIDRVYVRAIQAAREIEIISAGQDVVELAGPNESGKTTTIDAVCYALCGAAGVNPDALRHGEPDGEVTVEVGDLIVTRTFTGPGKGRLTIKPSGGQRDLDALYSSFSFAPLDIATRRPGETAAAFRKRVVAALSDLAGPDFKSALALADGAIADAEAERRDANRDLAKCGTLEPVPRVERVDTAAVELELRKVEAHNDAERARHDGERAELVKADQERQRLEGDAERAAAALEKAKTAMIEALRECRDTEADVVAAYTRAMDPDCSTDHKDMRIRWTRVAEAASLAKSAHSHADQADIDLGQADNTHCDAAFALESLPPLPDVIPPDLRDTEDLRRQLIEAGRTNEAAARFEDYQQELARRAEVAKLAVAAEQLLTERRAARAEVLASADLPLPGITWDEDDVQLEGISWDALSTGRRWRTAVDLAIAANERAGRPLRVIFIREGSLIDRANFEIITEAARAKGYQVWVESVRAHTDTAFEIEEGRVTKSPGSF